MANTTLQNLMTALRAAAPVDATSINFGWTDGLVPPYVTVTEYSHQIDRDTLNGVREATFSVLCVGKNVDEAEQTALAVDTILDRAEGLTPQSVDGVCCLQTSWQTGLVDPVNLYQQGVKLTYQLFEDPD